MQIFSELVDFLFPKSKTVYDLESLSSGDLTRLLPQAQDLGEDTVAIWNYAEPQVRELIWELKYRRNPAIVKHLSEVLYDVLRQELAERAIFENFTSPLLVPMPQSSKRKQERGWNQTEILCEELMRLDNEKLFEYAPHILAKERHTESQTKVKNKRERLRNVEHSMRATNHEVIEGRNIILIDDVTTTGATFKDAKRVLREARAKKVLCLALAH